MNMTPSPRTLTLSLLLSGSLLLAAGCSKAPPEVKQQAAAAPAASAKAAPAAKRQDVDSKRFQALIAEKSGVLLDVRTPGEYAEMHIAGAKAINIFDPEFDKKTATLPKDKKILVYCRSGARSARASDRLIAAGFKEVYNLSGGILGWKAAGLPVEK